jgi:hypothetical protein
LELVPPDGGLYPALFNKRQSEIVRERERLAFLLLLVDKEKVGHHV